MKELDRVLGIADEAQHSKTLKQFQEWDANVHRAIQVRILVEAQPSSRWSYPIAVPRRSSDVFSSSASEYPLWTDEVTGTTAAVLDTSVEVGLYQEKGRTLLMPHPASF